MSSAKQSKRSNGKSLDSEEPQTEDHVTSGNRLKSSEPSGDILIGMVFHGVAISSLAIMCGYTLEFFLLTGFSVGVLLGALMYVGIVALAYLTETDP